MNAIVFTTIQICPVEDTIKSLPYGYPFEARKMFVCEIRQKELKQTSEEILFNKNHIFVQYISSYNQIFDAVRKPWPVPLM